MSTANNFLVEFQAVPITFNEAIRRLNLEHGIIPIDKNVEIRQIKPIEDNKLVPRLCTCCGAPLPKHSNACEYCGVSYRRTDEVEVLRIKQELLIAQETSEKRYEEVIRAMKKLHYHI